MTKPIVNVADAKVRKEESGAHFAYTISELANAAGARDIGANITRVPPGKAAFPFHHHFGNEEHFFVLSGEGVLRYGAETYAVRQHDYIVSLPGGPERAHQLINTGKEELVYLAISTMTIPDAYGYPDSGKTGVRFAADVDSRFLVADGNKVARTYDEYWKGESGERVAAIVRSKKT